MENAARALPGAPAVVEAAKRAFFRSFFRLLLAFVAIAEWSCIAWVLHVAGVRLGLPVHVAGPLVIFLLNRRIVRRPRDRRPVDALMRLYMSLAFGSIFCALFLGVAGLAAVGGRMIAPVGV